MAVKTKLLNFRVDLDEKRQWEIAARDEGQTLTAWLRDSANMRLSNPPETPATPKGLSKPVPKKTAPKSSPSGCKHEGYENHSFCYRCQERT